MIPRVIRAQHGRLAVPWIFLKINNHVVAAPELPWRVHGAHELAVLVIANWKAPSNIGSQIRRLFDQPIMRRTSWVDQLEPLVAARVDGNALGSFVDRPEVLLLVLRVYELDRLWILDSFNERVRYPWLRLGYVLHFWSE
jgi:hypothetical protein